jgi:hypothetical protein
MTKQEMKLAIREYLLKTENARQVNDKEITVRCVFCGDSKKSRKTTHLYIKINLNENEPIVFNCFKCGVCGIFTPQILREFNMRSLELSSELLSYNNEMNKIIKHTMGKDNKLNFVIPTYKKENDLIYKKKLYVENRLGIKLEYNDLYKLKTIFSLNHFLAINKIDTMTINANQCNIINNTYIGFLSIRNEFINFRNTISDEYRYVKYSIYTNLDDTRKFYTIPNKIDLLSNKKIIINIAEGVFDIFGIYFNILNKEDDNMIYAAVCGSGYNTVIKYFIEKGIFGYVDLHIYSDKDKDPSFYKSMLKDKKYWLNDIQLFYNNKEKDFGVSKDKIQIIKKRL